MLNLLNTKWNLKLNKKGGLLDSRLGKFILILVSFGIVSFALFYILLPKLVDDKAPESLCRATVTARAAISEKLWGQSVTPIACQALTQKIKGDKEELQAQVAQLMTKCWWQFNEGRQDNVLKGNWEKFFGWSDQKNACFVCYDVAIAQDDIDGGFIDAPEMFDYMITSEHYRIKGLKNIDYIQSYGGAGKIAIMSPIVADQRYGIAYLPKNAEDAKFNKVDAGVSAVTVLAGLGVAACYIAEPCGLIATTAAIGAGAVVVGGVGYEAAHALDVAKAKFEFYSAKRATSMIVLDDYNTLQNAGCKIVKLEDD